MVQRKPGLLAAPVVGFTIIVSRNNKDSSATMNDKTPAPYGSWTSPIHSSLLTQKSVRLGEPQITTQGIFWLESRPQEKGRSVLVMQDDDGTRDITHKPYSVFSKAHEYGGGSYCVTDKHVFFVNAADQSIYRLALPTEDHIDLTGERITQDSQQRFADLSVDLRRNRLIAVCEDHTLTDREPVTSVVAINLDSGAVTSLLSGHDFYSNPSLSADGEKICWLCWDHPNMPWDHTECWVADLDYLGHIIHPMRIAGDTEESIFQPQWGPDGALYYVSDRNNWWNIYTHHAERTRSITCLEAEFATPQWVFGMSCYGFLDDQTILAIASQKGQWQMLRINLLTLKTTVIDTEWTDFNSLRCNGAGQAVVFAANPTKASRLLELTFADDGLQNSRAATLSSDNHFDTGELSIPEAISFATGSARDSEAHGFFYPPTNLHFTGPANAAPPLLVFCHGGPTGATDTGLNLKIQYWTSRGFAVADINYRGSTGYGRRYRDQLKGQWGISDVEDVCAAVEHLAALGLIDSDKAAIRGSSAGGYTVLAALTFSDTFKAGASLYGIGNLETLALDTHKFEARYLDSLVGPYPECRDAYLQRSPIHQPDGLNCPVIFFQGLDDKVVPPNQAEAMVELLQNKQIPVAYVPFEGEGHGFRQAQNIQRSLEAELSFYAQIFGFTAAGDIPPVEIIRGAS